MPLYSLSAVWIQSEKKTNDWKSQILSHGTSASAIAIASASASVCMHLYEYFDFFPSKV